MQNNADIDVSKLALKTATEMAAQKEQAITDMLNYKFGKDWNIEDIAQRLQIVVDPNGMSETFFMQHQAMLQFGTVITHTELTDSGQVKCTFHQEIRELYK